MVPVTLLRLQRVTKRVLVSETKMQDFSDSFVFLRLVRRTTTVRLCSASAQE